MCDMVTHRISVKSVFVSEALSSCKKTERKEKTGNRKLFVHIVDKIVAYSCLSRLSRVLAPCLAGKLRYHTCIPLDKRFLFLAFGVLVLSVYLGLSASRGALQEAVVSPRSGVEADFSPRSGSEKIHESVRIEKVNVQSSLELINLLQKNDLWDISNGSEVRTALLTNYPGDMDALEVKTKKKVFLNTLLSVARVALDEVELERERLQIILSKIGAPIQDVEFAVNNSGWKHLLSGSEVSFVKALTRKYRTRSADELLRRVDIVPLSLILAQGALESSWGTSRFAVEGNNIFGMWTWEGRGMVPNRRDKGKTHKVEIYDSILDSVRTYLLTLNRLSAYQELRDIRQHSLDSVDLAEGLFLYSERGDAYIQDIVSVIQFNRLSAYDYHLLSGGSGPENKTVSVKRQPVMAGTNS